MKKKEKKDAGDRVTRDEAEQCTGNAKTINSHLKIFYSDKNYSPLVKLGSTLYTYTI